MCKYPGPQTPTTTSNIDLLTFAPVTITLQATGEEQDHFPRVNIASKDANLMRSVSSQQGSTRDQPESLVTHFFCRAYLSEKVRTDTFDGNFGAKTRLCVRISSGTLTSLSHSRVVFGSASKSQPRFDKAG